MLMLDDKEMLYDEYLVSTFRLWQTEEITEGMTEDCFEIAYESYIDNFTDKGLSLEDINKIISSIIINSILRCKPTLMDLLLFLRLINYLNHYTLELIKFYDIYDEKTIDAIIGKNVQKKKNMLTYNSSPSISHISEVYSTTDNKLTRETKIFFKAGTPIDEILEYDNKHNSSLYILLGSEKSGSIAKSLFMDEYIVNSSPFFLIDLDKVHSTEEYKLIKKGIAETVYETYSHYMLPNVFVYNTNTDENVDSVAIHESAEWHYAEGLIIYLQNIAEIIWDWRYDTVL